MRVALLTREYPPDVYGGAGVHVQYLARELRRRVELSVHCWGAPRSEPGVFAHRPWNEVERPEPESAAFQALSIDLSMAASLKGAAVVHSHTWYANLAGHWAKLAWGIPHVATTHSLEPLRPWKREQLGGGYELSGYAERTGLEGADAVIAVSEGMRSDILACYPAVDPQRVRVIHNGIDPDLYRPERSEVTLRALGVDTERPYVVFVGRVTRQKGLAHLLRAAMRIDPEYQLVVCAGPADTTEIAVEVAVLAEQVRSERGGLVWLQGIQPHDRLVHLLTGATVFACPSVYEPFGLVNLEAMACETAVVASRVGGIPEIVVEGETGELVDWDPASPADFEAALAERIGGLLADPARASRMGEAGRRRVLERFSWPAIAESTHQLYRSLV